MAQRLSPPQQEKLENDAEELKLAVTLCALKLVQQELYTEEFELLGRRYEVKTDPAARTVIIRLLDPGRLPAVATLLCTSLFTFVGF